MPTIFRFVSLLLRRRQSEKAVKRILGSFDRWKEDQEHLPAYAVSGKRMLIIRLDDIGDWLLFRNNLGVYKNSPRRAGHEIVLLGNGAWKELFVALDNEKTDRVIWVDKSEYAGSSSYRLALWTQLRQEGFDTVVCPSRTRPLLLDDLCVLATGAARKIGSLNNFPDRAWNQLSDSLYTELFRTGDPLMHEFYFNGCFAQWCCGAHYDGQRPKIERAFQRKIPEAYILCFVGSSTKSKRWPVKRWIGLIRLLAQRQVLGGHDVENLKAKGSCKIVIAGGSGEQAMANIIQTATGAENIAGKASLTDMIDWVAGASAVVTNDTMAAHLGASCNRPTLIIANGTNSLRFTDYAHAGIEGVVTVYPQAFLRAREKQGHGGFHHTAVTADIASITAEAVAGKLAEMIGALA